MLLTKRFITKKMFLYKYLFGKFRQIRKYLCNVEAYLEPSLASTMECFFEKNVYGFDTKSFIVSV